MKCLLIMLSLTILTTLGCAEKKYSYARCNNEAFYKKWQSKCEEHSSTETSAFSKVLMGAILASIDVGIKNYRPPDAVEYQRPVVVGPVRENVYGMGVGSDASGRPVVIQGGTPNSHIQSPNAFGPGVHKDQYGNPVTWQPK